MRTSSYSISPAVPPSQPTTSPSGDIIRVAAKGKAVAAGLRTSLLMTGATHNIDGGPVLRKLRHPAPPFDEDNPTFTFTFDETLHGERLRQLLNLSHLDDALQNRIYALVKKYWSVFDDRGVWVPVRNYECVINTGDAPPIAVKNI